MIKIKSKLISVRKSTSMPKSFWLLQIQWSSETQLLKIKQSLELVKEVGALLRPWGR